MEDSIISIHALLAESDRFTISAHCLDSRISIHALLAESDPFLRSDPMMRRYFYPRSPCGERLEEVSGDTWQRDFYPRSPCGERLNELLEQSASYHISIHALLAESDCLPICKYGLPLIFLSTLSLRRATSACWRGCSLRYNFYPRSPCGERLHEALHRGRLLPISIHALLAESDPGPKSTTPDKYYFYPRSPCGERRGPRWKECRHPPFLSTLSLRRATPK